MKQISNKEADQIAKNREISRRNQISEMIHSESALANQLVREFGMTRSEALREAYRIISKDHK